MPKERKTAFTFGIAFPVPNDTSTQNPPCLTCCAAHGVRFAFAQLSSAASPSHDLTAPEMAFRELEWNPTAVRFLAALLRGMTRLALFDVAPFNPFLF
jgi:hypothetical protein